MSLTGTRDESIQSKLTAMVTDSKFEQFRDKLVGPLVHRGAWLTSLIDPHAGRWITVVPNLNQYKFNNSEYATMLRYRLLMPQRNIPEGLACTCKYRTKVDMYGHHLVTGCGCDGYRHRTHDTLVNEMCAISTYCGLWAKREELHVFKTASPNSNKRPDVSLINPFPGDDFLQQGMHNNNKLVLDVQMTSPIPGSQSGVFANMTTDASRQADRAAIAAYKDKNRTYKTLANNSSGISFYRLFFNPLVVLSQMPRNF